MDSVITNNYSNCKVALDALKNLTDPEIGLNIVDLGLIYQIDFDDELRNIYCTMTLTTKFCPMGESIIHAAEEILKNSFSEYETIINLTFEPSWNHDRISAEGKQFLNY